MHINSEKMFNLLVRFTKLIYNLHIDQRGWIGIEGSIILVSLVTVGAIFAYTEQSAGLFSAERSKETIYAGLKTTQSNFEISGSVVAIASNDLSSVKHILITVKNTIAGQPVNLTPCDGTANASNRTIISLGTGNKYFNNIKWSKTIMSANNQNNLLETGEQFEIDVDLDDLGDGKALAAPVGANDNFSFQIKATIGSVVTVDKKLPASLYPVMDLN
jgi:archaellin